LAVDADSNANLNEILAVPLEATLGSVREEMKDGVAKQGMTKQMFMEMKLAEAVFEGEGFDFIAMGRPEGAGCYCAANNLLSMYLGNCRRSRVQRFKGSRLARLRRVLFSSPDCIWNVYLREKRHLCQA